MISYVLVRFVFRLGGIFMFAKDLIYKTGTGMSPVLLAFLVIVFIVESIYAAYRTLKFYNEYIKNKRKNK